jgi:DNA-binding NarL/FixJ family response regulator
VVLRCIIVDDSELFLEGASALLEREGVDVVGVAANSAEALRCARELSPELALVDVDLGPESGFDLARRLTELPEPVHVVLISTYAARDLEDLVEPSGAVGFLSKRDVSRRAIDELLAGVSERPGR